MPVEAIAGPRTDPLEAVVLEQQFGFQVVIADPAVREIADDLGEHEHTECGAKEVQGRGVNRLARLLEPHSAG